MKGLAGKGEALVREVFLEEGGQSRAWKEGRHWSKKKGEEIFCKGTPCLNQEKVKCKLKTLHPCKQ